MNKPSRNKNNDRRESLLTGIPSWLPSLLPIVLISLALAACDSVPTEATVDTGGGGSALSYTGPACGTGSTDPATIEIGRASCRERV